MELRFRFDKSLRNFTFRQYVSTGKEIFCLVDTGVHIVHQVRLLEQPPHYPLRVVLNSRGQLRFLTGSEVVKVMHQACIAAYPAGHYLRLNIHCLVTHSNRVMAAVCLFLGGATIDEIAHKLRWSPSSVPAYLRDTFSGIGTVMQKTVAGVLNSH